jgi:predicted amidophosphoribosyltransferase
MDDLMLYEMAAVISTQCGARLDVADPNCTGCGKRLPVGANFCPYCGTPRKAASGDNSAVPTR